MRVSFADKIKLLRRHFYRFILYLQVIQEVLFLREIQVGRVFQLFLFFPAVLGAREVLPYPPLLVYQNLLEPLGDQEHHSHQ